MNVSKTQATQTLSRTPVRTWSIVRAQQMEGLNSWLRTRNSWVMVIFQLWVPHRSVMGAIHLKRRIQIKFMAKRLTTDITREFKAISAQNIAISQIRDQEICPNILTMEVIKIIKAARIHITSSSMLGSAQLHLNFPTTKITKFSLKSWCGHRVETKATDFPSSDTVKSQRPRTTIIPNNNGKIKAIRPKWTCNNTLTSNRLGLVLLPAPTSLKTSVQPKVTTPLTMRASLESQLGEESLMSVIQTYVLLIIQAIIFSTPKVAAMNNWTHKWWQRRCTANTANKTSRKHGVACNYLRRESAQRTNRLKISQLLVTVISARLNRILPVLSILSPATTSSSMYPNPHVLVLGRSPTMTVLKTSQPLTKTTARFSSQILCKPRLLAKMIQDTSMTVKWYLEALTASTEGRRAKRNYNSTCLNGALNQPDNLTSTRPNNPSKTKTKHSPNRITLMKLSLLAMEKNQKGMSSTKIKTRSTKVTTNPALRIALTKTNVSL